MTCPTCGKRGSVKIPRKILAEREFGTIKVQIPIGEICDDIFVLFVTPEGKVMGYEKVDPRVIEMLKKIK